MPCCSFRQALYYRVKSQATGETLDRRQEGLAILLTLRPIAVAGMAWAHCLHGKSSRNGLVVAAPARLAQVGRRWCRGCRRSVAALDFSHSRAQLDGHGRDSESPHVGNPGPYRWVRHPFYDSAALCMLANSLATANWFLFLTGALALLLLVVRTRKEEENLLNRFGDDYRAYMESTGRFLPKAGS